MKKTGLLILLTLAAWPVLSQRVFGWGLNVFPNITNRRLVAYSSISEEMVRQIERREISKPSYAANLFMFWRSERVAFELGAGFADTGYGTVEEPIPADDPDFANATSRSYKFRNYNLELPASLKFYQSLGENDYFNFMLGINIAYNLSNDTLKVLYNGGEPGDTRVTADTQEFRPLNYAFTTGIGWEHRFSPRFSLILQPTFAFWLKGILKDTEYTELNRNLYSFGLNVGFRFDRVIE